MAVKEQKLIEIMEIINSLKRENMDIISILQVFKEQNILDIDMSIKEIQLFLSELINIPLEDLDDPENILMEDFLNELSRLDENDFERDFDSLDSFNFIEKRKRYLN